MSKPFEPIYEALAQIESLERFWGDMGDPEDERTANALHQAYCFLEAALVKAESEASHE